MRRTSDRINNLQSKIFVHCYVLFGHCTETQPEKKRTGYVFEMLPQLYMHTLILNVKGTENEPSNGHRGNAELCATMHILHNEIMTPIEQ